MEEQQQCYTILYKHDNTFSIVPPLDFTPSKLFTGDSFAIINRETMLVQIVKSPIRAETKIPAVLVLEGNRTYGRDKKNGKLLYKCRPDNALLPTFLVPYEIKRIGFSKSLVNLYVTIQFTHWDNKHPQGQLTMTIGPVNINEHFYDYQIYCKGLHFPIHSLSKHCQQFIKNRQENDLETRHGYNVFTIDPKGCTDFDDAFSITRLEDGNISLSIYISNVPVVLEEGALWQHFADRIATIYLPNKKIPMLPPCLSEGLCSLLHGEIRHAFTLDLLIEPDSGNILSYTFLNTKIRVKRNYIYEENDLLLDTDYIVLYELSRKMYTKTCFKIGVESKETGIKDSHDVVAYFMILMNHYCAQKLDQGIFRQVTHNSTEYNNILLWKHNYNALYTLDKYSSHEALGLETYTQITSPIRRMVDLVNMIQIQRQCGLAVFSEPCLWFYNRMTTPSNIENINNISKKIKRLQNECSLLQLLSENSIDTIYDGIFISIEKYLFKDYTQKIGTIYLIYFPSFKRMNNNI
jgi:exoribonuclease R